MTKKTWLAPLGATYKRDIRLRWSRPRPDAAPNGAKHVLVGHSYKDFAPPELVQRHSPAKFMRSFLCVPCDLLRLSPTSVTSVRLL